MSKCWDIYRKRLGEETEFYGFKLWNSVQEIPIYSYDDFLNHYVLEDRELLAKRSDKAIWLKALKEPIIGHSVESYKRAYRNLKGYPCTVWTLKTANHLLMFENKTGMSIHAYEQIVDFGAGIGETTRMIHDLGYKGDLYICDFPEVSKISSYYLTQLGIKHTTVDNVKKIPNDKRTLFIATWSLSEVPLKDRKKIIERFKGHDFLIIAQKTFYECDNEDYFRNTFPKQAGVDCIYVDTKLPFTKAQDHHKSFHVFGLAKVSPI